MLFEAEKLSGQITDGSLAWLQQKLSARWFPANMEAVARFVTEKSASVERFCFYGAGTHTLTLLNILPQEVTAKISMILDGHPKQGQKIQQWPVAGVERYQKDDLDEPVILSHREFEDGMRRVLIDKGIDSQKIISIYDNPGYGELALESVRSGYQQPLKHYLETRDPQKRVVLFVTTRERRVVNGVTLAMFAEQSNYSFIRINLDSNTPINPDEPGYELTFDLGGSYRLCFELIEVIRPDLLYLQEHYDTGNFMPMVVASHFPKLQIVGELYDFLEIIFDDPTILARESYWSSEDVALGVESEHWCKRNLSAMVTKEGGDYLKQFFAGVEYIEFRPEISPAHFKDAQQKLLDDPVRLVYAGAVNPSYTSTAMYGDNQLIDVFEKVTGLGFDLTLHSSCPSMELLETRFSEYTELAAHASNFTVYPAMAQAALIETMAERYHFGMMLGIPKENTQQRLNSTVTVSAKMFSYLAAGLPLIVGEYLELMAGWVREHGLGIVINHEEIDRLPEIIQACDYPTLQQNVLNYRETHNLNEGVKRLQRFIDRHLAEARS